MKIAVLALASCIALQLVVEAAAQEERPRVAIGNAGWAATTKPGAADGASSPALTGERRPLYRLSISDAVDIICSFAPEFNQSLTVQPDGLIILKELGAIAAAGLTLPELQQRIRTGYSTIMRDPEITVVLKDFERPYFTALGEVSRPGKYELRGEITITEAVAMAGGFTSRAKHSQVVMFRKDAEEQVSSRVFDLKRILKSRDLAENFRLQSGDLLYVPQNQVSKWREYLPGANLGMYWNSARY